MMSEAVKLLSEPVELLCESEMFLNADWNVILLSSCRMSYET